MPNSQKMVLRCPTLKDLPPPPEGKTGWPWTEQGKTLPETASDGKQWPKVSIVTPCYNQGRFIEEAIRSVLLQGYPGLEYIIVDGGSTDETVDIIKKYEPWLAYWESKPDKGQSHAINKGLERSTGKFFNWHNSDDVLAPDSLATMVSAMIKYPQAAYVHGRRIFIDDKGKVRSGNKHSCDNEISFSPELTASVSALKTGPQPACLMDRELVIQAGGVDENLHYIMDIDVLLRIALIKKPIYINSVLSYVRIHPDTKSLQWNSRRAKERIYVANKIFSSNDLPCSIIKLKRQTLATAHRFAWRSYARAGMYGFAAWHLLLDISFSPFYGWKQRLATYKLFKLDKKVVKFDEEI
ncbi:MAG: glycosyltransferase family 2 protein [Phycisphaerae bacterium]|nr:glycosyltransferase family 2 protein [Phycisphaerae bacterium]